MLSLYKTVFNFYYGKVAAVYFGNFKSNFGNKLVGFLFEPVRNYNVKYQICVHGTVNNAKIVNGYFVVYAIDNLKYHFFELIDTLIIDDKRIIVDRQVNAHLLFYIVFNIVDDVVADHNVYVGGNLNVNRCKELIGTVIVHY